MKAKSVAVIAISVIAIVLICMILLSQYAINSPAFHSDKKPHKPSASPRPSPTISRPMWVSQDSLTFADLRSLAR